MVPTWMLLPKPSAAKHLAKDIIELWSTTKSSKAPKLWLWVIILGTFLFITQHSIGSLDVLELGRVSALVRMMLAGQFSKGLFDFSGCGSSWHT